jgi:hypothetical protein
MEHLAHWDAHHRLIDNHAPYTLHQRPAAGLPFACASVITSLEGYLLGVVTRLAAE